MPIKQNKPFNPCPTGQTLCNPMDGNDKSCCPNKDPKLIKKENNIITGAPRTRSNIPLNLPKFEYNDRPTKNIERDIVVSGNKPIPRVTYAKDGTRRFEATEKKKYKNIVNNINQQSPSDDNGMLQDPNPPCACFGEGSQGTNVMGVCEGTCSNTGNECGWEQSWSSSGNTYHWHWNGCNATDGDGIPNEEEWDGSCETNPDGYHMWHCPITGQCVHKVYNTNAMGQIINGSFYTIPECPGHEFMGTPISRDH